LPLYVVLSLGVTPVFRTRLNEKFKRYAENQAFLVEAVARVETVKSMALEPVLQLRWEEQIAGYVTAAFRVVGLGAFATQSATLINKLLTVLILFFGAKLVIDNRLTVGELVAFNIIAAQLSAPVLRLAQLWPDFQQVRLSIDRLADILNATPEPASAARRACRQSMARSASTGSPSAIASTAPRHCGTWRSTSRRVRSSASSDPRARARAPWPG
jgi:subfamily B ATP-binding cassette protein HlyB/CyaB